jgi:hypothetical protein
MELVEGPTLADGIRQGPLPLDDRISTAPITLKPIGSRDWPRPPERKPRLVDATPESHHTTSAAPWTTAGRTGGKRLPDNGLLGKSDLCGADFHGLGWARTSADLLPDP